MAAASTGSSSSLHSVALPAAPAVLEKKEGGVGVTSRIHQGTSGSAITAGAADLLNSQSYTEGPQKTYERNLQITSFVIAMLGLLLVSVGLGGWGLSMTRSFGFLYHFAGTHFLMLGLGLFASSIVFLMASQCRCGKPAGLEHNDS